MLILGILASAILLALAIIGTFGAALDDPWKKWRFRTRKQLREKEESLAHLLREGVMTYPQASDEFLEYSGINAIFWRGWIDRLGDAAQEGLEKRVVAQIEARVSYHDKPWL